MNTDQFFRYFTLVLLIFWSLLWKIKSRQADKEKPRVRKETLESYFNAALFQIASLIIFFQLLGVQIFPRLYSLEEQIFGLVLILVGISISVSGRLVLASNWTNAHQYQIKENHDLVTSGIYQYIRHPIYSGIIFVAVGAELVASSNLFLPAFLVALGWSYLQAEKEERLLTSFFKKKYTQYMSKTKRFIPYLF